MADAADASIVVKASIVADAPAVAASEPVSPVLLNGSALADPVWCHSAPAWVAPLLHGGPVERLQRGRLSMSWQLAPTASLVSVRVSGARGLSPAEFEQTTADAYTAIAERLHTAPASHPVRFWNYIPAIHGECGPDLDRYMVFNAGRHAACSSWLGGEAAFPRLLATASGVGHDGSDFYVHALAAARPGVAVENPRQVPAYRYSKRYGPKPPCFARATVVNLAGRQQVLVGGTASVRGEESVHIGHLQMQVGETLDNLAALLQAASGKTDAGPHLFSDVRVYLLNGSDERVITPLMKSAFSQARVEYVRADICRKDLIVEIEGIAAA